MFDPKSREAALAFLRGGAEGDKGGGGADGHRAGSKDDGDSSSSDDDDAVGPARPSSHPVPPPPPKDNGADAATAAPNSFIPPPPPGFGSDSDSDSDSGSDSNSGAGAGAGGSDFPGPRSGAGRGKDWARLVPTSGPHALRPRLPGAVTALAVTVENRSVLSFSRGSCAAHTLADCTRSLARTGGVELTDPGLPPRAVCIAQSGTECLISDGGASPYLCETALFVRGTGARPVRFKEGDRYAHDLRNARGHVATVTSALWLSRGDSGSAAAGTDVEAVTGSLDGTVRLWHPERAERGSSQVLRAIATRAMENGMSSLSEAGHAGPAAGAIIAGTVGGALVCFDPRSRTERPRWISRAAHAGTVTSVGAFAHYLCSRGTDGTVKVWDLRAGQAQPASAAAAHSRSSGPGVVHAWGGVPAAVDQADCGFAPTGTVVFAATAAANRGTGGAVVFFDTREPSAAPLVAAQAPAGVSVNRVIWDHDLDEWFAGLSDGSVLAYSKERDARGSSRAPRASVGAAVLRDDRSGDDPADGGFDVSSVGEILNPHGMPAFNVKQGRKRGRDAGAGSGNGGASDPAAATAPAKRPTAYAGLTNQSVHQAFNSELVSKDLDWKVDAREAILRHAGEDESSVLGGPGAADGASKNDTHKK